MQIIVKTKYAYLIFYRIQKKKLHKKIQHNENAQGRLYVTFIEMKMMCKFLLKGKTRNNFNQTLSQKFINNE